MDHALCGRIQEEGLEIKYNDPHERGIKQYTHMLLALFFVRLDDVKKVFALLKRTTAREGDFEPIPT